MYSGSSFAKVEGGGNGCAFKEITESISLGLSQEDYTEHGDVPAGVALPRKEVTVEFDLNVQNIGIECAYGQYELEITNYAEASDNADVDFKINGSTAVNGMVIPLTGNSTGTGSISMTFDVTPGPNQTEIAKAFSYSGEFDVVVKNK